MNLVVQGNNTIAFELIKSCSVNTAAGRVEVLIKHKTKKSDKEKVSVLADPRKQITEEIAQTFVDEISSFQENPETPIEKAIHSAIWSAGHLALDLKGGSDDFIPASALAHICWGWSNSQTPTDKQLELRMGMAIEEISEAAKHDGYADVVKRLMTEHRTPTEFADWVKSYGNMNKRFGARMRLSEDAVAAIVKAVADTHGVDVEKKPKKSATESSSSEPQDYDVVWGEFNEPESTKYKLYGRTTVSAPSLNRAKTLATQQFNDWLESEIDEKDEAKHNALVKAQESMRNGAKLSAGKWEDGKARSFKVIGQHMNVWSGLFVKVSLAK